MLLGLQFLGLLPIESFQYFFTVRYTIDENPFTSNIPCNNPRRFTLYCYFKKVNRN